MHRPFGIPSSAVTVVLLAVGWSAAFPGLTATAANPPAPTPATNSRRPGPAPANAPHAPSPAEPPKRWVVVGDQPDAGFGVAAAAASDVNGDGFSDVIVSAPETNGSRGRVFIYFGSAQGLGTQPGWQAEGEQPGDRFGFTVAGVGDVNRDGYADVAIVAAGPPGPPEWSRKGGAAYLFLGSAAGPAKTPARVWRTPEWGVTVLHAGPAGDVNGDGIADLYLAGYLATPGGGAADHPTVMVFHGSPGGLGAGPDWTVRSDLTLDNFGDCVSPAGDVNGDGFGDLLIGAGGDDILYLNGGCAYVYYGSARGLSPVPNWTARYPFPVRKDIDTMGDMQFGKVACGAGDANGDGYADVLIGARYASHGDNMEGLIFAYYGSANGLATKPSWWQESNQAKSSFGSSVGGLGDVNGDGYADVIAGAPTATDNQWGEGAVAVFLGSAHGLKQKPHWSLESDRDREEMGSVVGTAGDVNGDGFADVLIASSNYTPGAHKVGAVMVYYGSATGLKGNFDWRIEKPWLIAVQQEWDHLVIKQQEGWAYAGMTLLAGLAGGGAWWFRRRRRERLTHWQQQAVMAERSRLAQDLHDEVGSQLTRLMVLSSQADEANSPAHREQWRAELDLASVGLANALDHVVWRLQPGQHSLERVADLVVQHAEKAFATARVPCRMHVPLDLPSVMIEESARENLVRAVKEAVTNVIRHSQASEARLEVAPNGHTVTFIIADDGRGLALASGDASGDGLANMQKRMKSVGGGFKLHSQPGQGVRVELTVPTCPLPR